MKKKILKATLILTMLFASTIMLTGCGYTGMRCDNGTWRYVKEDQVQYNFTGMANNEYGWWYFENGLINWNYTGMACNDWGWWYFRNGQLDWNYTGLANNIFGQWLYQNGNLNFNYNGNWGDYHITNGHVDHKHTYSTFNAYQPTCTTSGYTGDVKCTTCYTVKSYGKHLPAYGHNTAKRTTLNASCSSEGLSETYCKTCGSITEKTSIPKLPHKSTEIFGKYEPTCTTDGYTGDEVCTVCNEIIKSGKPIPAKGHNYIVYDEIDATCSHGTTKYLQCTDCPEYTYETNNDKLEHSFTTIYEEKYSCTQDEYKLEQCDFCHEYRESHREALGHDYKLSNDKKSIVCDKCKSTFTETISDKVRDGKMYASCGSNIAIGQNLTIDGNTINIDEYDFYELNKMYADFWSNMRIESSNKNAIDVLKHDYQTYFQTDACNGVTVDQQDVLKAKSHGKSHIKIYFHDILFDEFDVYVGASIVDGIKAARAGNTDASVFDGYSSIQKDATIAAADMLNATVNDNMTDYEKVIAIKNWYKSNVNYCLTGANSNPSCEIFLNHQGRCEDYAETFSLLLEVLGIENYYVNGSSSNYIETYDADGNVVINNGHAWNILKLDAGNGKGQQWYYADMTWDQFNTENTVPELNTLDGFGFYKKDSTQNRTATSFIKLRPSDMSADTRPWTYDSSQNNLKDFTEFTF